MQFINHTPFPAMAFVGLNQLDESFHCISMRQTFTWNEAGQLIFAENQDPLATVDEFFDDSRQSGVRQESDLCPYKPRCDVIVNATAYPPAADHGKEKKQFKVRFTIRRPDEPGPIPPFPEGLNPMMSPSENAIEAWHSAVAKAKHTVIPGARLIDKSLNITGERKLVKRSAFFQLTAKLLKFCTVGVVRISPWRLTSPRPATPLPIQLQNTFGGQCRVDADNQRANKVPKKFRLTQQQIESHPDFTPPLAHEALAINPIGVGFWRDWYLAATNVSSLEVPRIENPSHPITLKLLNQVRNGKFKKIDMLVAGLGVRPKGQPQRAKLAGTIDEQFIRSRDHLPKDFDFALWNAAWPDQQIDTPLGDEIIELTNLCRPELPGVYRDDEGNHVLKLNMPQWQPYVLIRFKSGELALAALSVDTLIIEPERQTVSMVFRSTFSISPLIRCVEARQMPISKWKEALSRFETTAPSKNDRTRESNSPAQHD